MNGPEVLGQLVGESEANIRKEGGREEGREGGLGGGTDGLTRRRFLPLSQGPCSRMRRGSRRSEGMRASCT